MQDRSTGAEDRERRARIEAQNAVQWLARLACSYVDAPGDPIRLEFERETPRVLTLELTPGIRVGLTLPTLILQFEERGTASPHPLDLDDKSSTEVEAWLLAELLHRGLDRDRFSKRLPYDWPHTMSGDELKYAPRDLADDLSRLTRELGQAADRLIEARRALDVGHHGADAALSCWPEALEIGFVEPSRVGPVKVVYAAGERDGGPAYRVIRGSPGSATSIEIAAGSAPDTAIVERLVAAASSGRRGSAA